LDRRPAIPAESLTTYADAVAKRTRVAEHQIQKARIRVDDDRAGPFGRLIKYLLPQISRIDPADVDRRNGKAFSRYRAVIRTLLEQRKRIEEGRPVGGPLRHGGGRCQKRRAAEHETAPIQFSAIAFRGV